MSVEVLMLEVMVMGVMMVSVEVSIKMVVEVLNVSLKILIMNG